MATTERPKAAPPRNGALAERTITDLLKTEDIGKRFERYAPTKDIGRAIHTSMILAVQQSPQLMLAPQLKLLQAAFGLCRLGLEINTPRQHAYVIPFKGREKVEGQWRDVILPQVVVGYRGYVHLALGSGKAISIGGNVVDEGDVFDYQFGAGAERSFLKHKFGPERDEERGKPIFAYCTVDLKDGSTFDVMSWPSVIRIRDRSQGYESALKQGTDSNAYLKNPWNTDPRQMGIKTVIRRKSKTLDLSPSLDMAVRLDEMAERGEVDYGTALDLDPSEWKSMGVDAEVEREEERKPAETKSDAAKEEKPAGDKPAANGRADDPPPPEDPRAAQGTKPKATRKAAEPKGEAQQASGTTNGAGAQPERTAAPPTGNAPPPPEADDFNW
jgi:phage RecT family recombinase